MKHKKMPKRMEVQVRSDYLRSLGQNVIESLADAQKLGCAACLRKSDDYVIIIGSVFNLEVSPDAQFTFSALCGECFEAARTFGLTKRG